MENLKDSNDKFIGTKKTAEILGVSESTVRRLADKGELNCYTIAYNKYRKFSLKEITEFKEYNLSFKDTNILDKDNSFVQLSLDLKSEANKNKESLKNIKSKSHPSHYLMHKYWGRKPHNVVSEYIENYTEPGDILLDPFAGSGVAPIEAIKINRRAIGVDINPMSKFIALNTVSKVDLNQYAIVAQEVMFQTLKKLDYLYETTCPHCLKTARIEIAIWDEEDLIRIRGKCSKDGIFIKDADSKDISLYKLIEKEKETLELNGDISYPKDKVLKYVKRSGKESIDQLFTSRALIILSNLRDEIIKVKNKELQSLLLFTFTSMLANVSNMLPGDVERATYKSGWVISKFWTPKVHTERNVFHCFDLRIKAILRGKKELLNIQNELLTYKNTDSSNLSFLEDNSIDYIFTDPPYGESIAYLALSQFWNSWLNNIVDYENEIVVDTNRNKDYLDYSKRMEKTFRELYRVLKPGRFLSFTFHNRDLNVWKSVIDAYKNSGFILKDITLQQQAVSSGTQGINKINTLTGDFIYTLLKPLNDEYRELYKRESMDNFNNEEYVKELIEKTIDEHQSITPSKLYEKIIPVITEEECYFDSNGKAIDIEKILKDNYKYSFNESNTDLGGHYVWEKIK